MEARLGLLRNSRAHIVASKAAATELCSRALGAVGGWGSLQMLLGFRDTVFKGACASG